MTQTIAEKTDTPAEPKAAPPLPAARFRASHRELTDAMNLAALAVPSRPPVPVMRGIIAHARGRSVTISAYDYQVAVSVTVPAEAGSTGRSLLDHEELTKVLAAAVAGETKADAQRMSVAVDAEQLSTPDVSVPLTALSLEDYPPLPEPVAPRATLDAPEFFRQLARVLPAAGKDDTLPVLTCVQMKLTADTLTLYATDRYRLTEAQVSAEPWDEADAATAATSVPAEALRTIAKRLGAYAGPVSIGIRDGNDGAVTFRIGSAELTLRTVSADDFPHLQKLIPTTADTDTAVTVTRASLIKAGKKAHALLKAKGMAGGHALFQWDAAAAMTLAPGIGSEEQDKVRGAAVTSSVARGDAAALQGRRMAMNAAFLLVALDAFTSDTVTIHLPRAQGTSYFGRVLFTEGPDIGGNRYRHVVMAVRLEEPAEQ